jgi:glycosyltransferase involved in cell wall biosynthesis
MSKKILWLNWKDINHPLAGGAEVVTHELCKKLVEEGNQVTLLTSQYQDAKDTDEIDGIKIVRVGENKFLHGFQANWYYTKHLKNQFDIIIEEVNTAPYFINFSKGKEKVFLFYHQLARQVWFFETKLPLNLIGYYLLEPLACFLQSRFKSTTITISDSTKNDLIKLGFKKEKIKIITEFIDNKPLVSLEKSLPKDPNFTVLYHGSLREMKRPDEVVKAFGLFVKKYPQSQLWISGGGDQSELISIAMSSNFLEKVAFFGRTGDHQKLELMQKSTVLCATSVKEGWGLIVTEANSMGTPAIVYNVDGLRDSAKSGGNWIVEENPEALAIQLEKTYQLFISNPEEYQQKCSEVLEKSRQHTVQQSYTDFIEIIGL